MEACVASALEAGAKRRRRRWVGVDLDGQLDASSIVGRIGDLEPEEVAAVRRKRRPGCETAT
jgi:hypothetical protein